MGSDLGMQAEEILKALLTHYNVLVYGPPGTGKTHKMQEVAHLFEAMGSGSGSPVYLIDTESETHPILAQPAKQIKVGWVTFHQSYSYEEFIVGLRPDPQETGKLLSLRSMPGLLLELAEFARQPGSSALLIIDEINRGNVSRIFGEFITLLEPDKRLDENGDSTERTVRVRLPYIRPGTAVKVDIGTGDVEVPNPFTMPLRLYTLASMNSVDKSVAPLDTALRRRFHVVNLMPDLKEMAQHMNLPQPLELEKLKLPKPLNDVQQVKMLGLALLRSLNREIGLYLGTEFSLGEWYLVDLAQEDISSVDEAKSTLARIWDFRLLPQLEELFHGRIEQLETVLGLDTLGADSGAPVHLERPEDKLEERGAVPYLSKRPVDVDGVLQFLCHMARVEQESVTPDAASGEQTTPESTNLPAGETTPSPDPNQM